jgi:hypothetical protein
MYLQELGDFLEVRREEDRVATSLEGSAQGPGKRRIILHDEQQAPVGLMAGHPFR